MAIVSTKLEADGAEFLVLGHLLVRGVEAHKTYTNTAGHDVVAVGGGKSCRIQVKARTWVDADKGFPISNFASDFVVNVRLNKGYEAGVTENGRAYKAKEGGAVAFYIFPTAIVQAATGTDAFSKCLFKNIDDVEQYRDAWHLIEAYLAVGAAHSSTAPASDGGL